MHRDKLMNSPGRRLLSASVFPVILGGSLALAALGLEAGVGTGHRLATLLLEAFPLSLSVDTLVDKTMVRSQTAAQRGFARLPAGGANVMGNVMGASAQNNYANHFDLDFQRLITRPI